jgi:beta-alanine degradation protein BauB
MMGKSLAMAVAIMLGCAGSLRAQDVAVVNPKSIRVKLDNEHVRVLEATLTPGYKENPHSHPSSIVYVLAGGKVRSHLPDGTSTEATYTAGQTVYRDPVPQHWAENIGKTTIRLIVVELKPQPRPSI